MSVKHNAPLPQQQQNRTSMVSIIIFKPPDRMIGGLLFCPVCLSVCLLSTLTFAITFEPLEIETPYLTCMLH